ncbi:hypothetical protein GCM10012284_57970 [Mangrovihabitans endophyticus]|uniref:Uncharacterized protein n=1 Tax=Mangrovihabitans endophyticus TaxID=1751298 RepID=A0A8J3C6Q7_9ACTN|nr:hypothetical protein GCM10012284_57970 [Mangrovihabitans endophyticus]
MQPARPVSARIAAKPSTAASPGIAVGPGIAAVPAAALRGMGASFRDRAAAVVAAAGNESVHRIGERSRRR